MRSLYARLLAMFLAVLVAAMGLLSVLLYQRIRNDKIDARLRELTSQARDVAYLAGQGSAETNTYLVWKCREIMREFDAYILIIDRDRTLMPIGDETMELTYDFTFEQTLLMLGHVLAGNDIQMKTTLDTGNPVFTVGVPFTQDGAVLGAVFIHTSEQSIESSYREIVAETSRVTLFALAIGALLILIASQLITQPLRQMARAADRFAQGDFSRKIPVDSQDEVGRLAESLNKMAEDLDRLEQTRRGFVANVSHELRSPLTSIQGFINGILDGTVPGDEREHYLNIVLEETRRLNKLITTLLDLTQIEGGETKPALQRFDINEMIARVLFRQEARIESKNIDVQIEFEQETCPVSADPDQIEQVLINLMDNAVKYGREGGVMTLATRRQGGTVTVSVADDGQGIPAEDLPFVFDRFYMADKAHTTGKGTGLGLAIVKSIIEQHGQTIRAESEPGKGTTFAFTLQAAEAPNQIEGRRG